jgi:hypothetical protein
MLHLDLQQANPQVKITSHPKEVRLTIEVPEAYHELTLTPDKAELIGEKLAEAANHARKLKNQ